MLDSLRIRLLLWYTLILALVIAVFAGTVCYLYWQSLVTDVDRQLTASASRVAQALHPATGGDFDLDRPPEYSGTAASAPVVDYIVWSAQGELIDQSNADIEATVPAAPGVRTRGARRELTIAAAGGAIVMAGRDLSDVNAAVLSLAGSVGVAGFAALVLSLVGGWFLTGRALAPVARISRAAAAMSAGDLSARIAIERTESELEQVAHALNQGFDQLQMAAEMQRRFTADASHELRTPLATLGAEIDWALARERPAEQYRGALETCRRASARMRRVVEGLLTLARSDVDRPRRSAPVALAAAAEDAMVMLQPLAKVRGITIDAGLADATVLGDSDALAELAANLVSNAIEYNRDGGTVRIEVSRDNGTAVLRVIDTGIGIAADDLPHVFDRFYRADRSRARQAGGAGLGLAIARSIAQAHGGDISCRSTPGEGTEMTVRLPAATIMPVTSAPLQKAMAIALIATVAGSG